jgi:hypothetical protein
LFIGTPHGFNHFYDLYQAAQVREGWATFQFTTEQGGNVSASELEQAADEMDERTWRQEFQASLENLSQGQVYFAFDRSQNVRSLGYDPRYPLCWSLDFNVNPMCSVIGQNIGDEIHVLDEMNLMHANTLEACKQFLDKTESWAWEHGTLNVYGDATGDSRHSSADKTDWHLVRNFFERHAGQYRVEVRVPSQNPLVKARVNAVNSMLCTYSGSGGC